MFRARDLPFDNQTPEVQGVGRIQMKQGHVEAVLQQDMRSSPPALVKRYLGPWEEHTQGWERLRECPYSVQTEEHMLV